MLVYQRVIWGNISNRCSNVLKQKGSSPDPRLGAGSPWSPTDQLSYWFFTHPKKKKNYHGEFMSAMEKHEISYEIRKILGYLMGIWEWDIIVLWRSYDYWWNGIHQQYDRGCFWKWDTPPKWEIWQGKYDRQWDCGVPNLETTLQEVDQVVIIHMKIHGFVQE